MCLRTIYYPLVKLNTGKQKLLLNYGVKVSSREEYDELLENQKRNIYSVFGLSNMQSLNQVYKKEGITSFIKMISIPCGCCRECMNMISREWAFRITAEAKLYPNNSYFVTLTYDDDKLPSDMMLDSKLISNFNKKLKTYLNRKGWNSDFRFYGVGEYGSNTARPHYHIIYFNLDLQDIEVDYINQDKNMILKSEFLNEVWANGFVTIGEVTIASASYVARYCDKKKRLNKTERQELIDEGIVPEYSVMSRRPGIGSYLFDDLKEDFENGIYQHYINGKSYSIPTAWLKKIKESYKVGTLPTLAFEQAQLALFSNDPLTAYQAQADFKSGLKIHQLLNLSDNCNLDDMYKRSDKITTRRKL